LITLNPSTLTFFLDRRFSNLFKMIKVGIKTIRTRNVIIASFHSRSAAAAARSISGPAAPNFPIFLGMAGNGPAIELEADLGFRHD
jgi:hypothetical protein